MMRRWSSRTASRRRGAVYVLSLILLTILSAMAAAFAARTNLALSMGTNQKSVLNAQMQAESGLNYLTHVLDYVELPASPSGTQRMTAIASPLQETLNGAGMIAGDVTVDERTITIPAISYAPSGGSFAAVMELTENDTVLDIRVTGASGNVMRTIGLKYQVDNGSSGIFRHGLISKGPFMIKGNARLKGANDPSEADVLVMNEASEVGELGGNSRIDGDVFGTASDVTVDVSGNSSIGGYTCRDEELTDHIHSNAPYEDIPEVDGSRFEAMATNLVTAATNTNGNKTFRNIRIRANTHPTFSGNIKIEGVVFVETPNIVTFSGNLTIRAVIVTQDAGDEAFTENRVQFRGNTNVQGPETLPDSSEFAELKETPGAFILAPGFGVEFRGNFGTVSGCMAADEFTFRGNAGGTILGSLINYGNTTVDLRGNSNFTFDRSQTPQVPPGFAPSEPELVLLPSSYTEY